MRYTRYNDLLSCARTNKGSSLSRWPGRAIPFCVSKLELADIFVYFREIFTKVQNSNGKVAPSVGLTKFEEYMGVTRL